MNHEGSYQLDVEVSATERFKNDGASTSHQKVELPTLHFEYDRSFADAQRRCNGDLVQMSADLQKLSAAMQAYKNAPDPQPDLRLGEILAAAVAVNESMKTAADKMGKTGSVFLQELSRNTHLASEVAATRGSFIQAAEQTRGERHEQAATDPALERK